jgi:hypothetical protein
MTDKDRFLNDGCKGSQDVCECAQMGSTSAGDIMFCVLKQLNKPAVITSINVRVHATARRHVHALRN